MATANAMHARLSAARKTFFAEGDAAPLVLAHGRARDMPAFGSGAEAGAAREADAWLASDRRRCFLAAMGAGTVDQALLAVLPVRHAMLRLFGLSRRVLVVDEAHAYDAYMRTELTTLLEFQAAMGGSAILLSATLTRKAREAFATAFRKGLGAGPTQSSTAAYPLATIVSREALRETPCELRPTLARRVAIRRIADAEAALEAVLDASGRGAAVAWIRNTVGDVMVAADALRAAGADPLVFHARFAMGDRLAIEDEVLRRFGKESTPDLRRGRIVVASQVLESSLDICFDAMVTDLAPIDLLIQRAGRLWRHARDPRPVPGPELLLLSPEAPDDAPPDWPGVGFGGTARVYPHRAVLWRSARAALEAGAIETPGNLRALVEAAYEGFTPPGLEDNALRAEGKETAAAGQARFNLLRLKDAYGEGQGPWPTDHKVPTRLGEPSFTFRLARWDEGELRPIVEAAGNAWSLSEISLPERLIKAAAPDVQSATALAALQAGWREWEAEIPVLILRPEGDGWVGRAVDGQGREVGLTYRRDRGLGTVRG
jgi:CRISPR-associated endonuclease/helicase Cas3